MENAPPKRLPRLAIVGIVVLLFVSVIAIVLLRNYSAEAPEATETVETNTATSAAKPSTLEYIASALPPSWKAADTSATTITLRNETTNCFVSATSSANANDLAMSEDDHKKQVVAMVSTKGYKATESTEQVTVAVKEGTKTISAQGLQITGNGTTMQQLYAHVLTKESYTILQVSCPSQDAFTDAVAAAQAIRLLSL